MDVQNRSGRFFSPDYAQRSNAIIYRKGIWIRRFISWDTFRIMHIQRPLTDGCSDITSINLCCIPLDESLQDLIKDKPVQFTRFADDLCFSSAEEITPYLTEQILLHIQSLDWTVNKEKTSLLRPDQDKEVTGLIVGSERIYLSPDFLKTLKAEVKRYAIVYEAAVISGRPHSRWIQRYKEKIEGMIRFAAEADERPEASWRREATKFDRSPKFSDQEVLSWRDFPYI